MGFFGCIKSSNEKLRNEKETRFGHEAYPDIVRKSEVRLAGDPIRKQDPETQILASKIGCRRV